MCLFKLYTHSELILLSQTKNELELGAVLKPNMVFLRELVLVVLSLSVCREEYSLLTICSANEIGFSPGNSKL